MDLLLPFSESGPGKDPCVLQMFMPLSVIQPQLFLFKDVQKLTDQFVKITSVQSLIHP